MGSDPLSRDASSRIERPIRTSARSFSSKLSLSLLFVPAQQDPWSGLRRRQIASGNKRRKASTLSEYDFADTNSLSKSKMLLLLARPASIALRFNLRTPVDQVVLELAIKSVACSAAAFNLSQP